MGEKYPAIFWLLIIIVIIFIRFYLSQQQLENSWLLTEKKTYNILELLSRKIQIAAFVSTFV